jgi:hypothetical protein
MMDIGFDTDGDLLIRGGDFVVVESTGEHQKQLILLDKGEIKDNPTVGVGAFGYIDNEELDQLPGAIAVEFARDGMDVVRVALDKAGNVQADALYK